MVGEEAGAVTIEALLESGAIIGHKDGNHGSQYPRVEEFGPVGVPFLTAKSLSDGKIDIAGAPRLAEDRADALRFGFVQPGDVLLSHNATVGRVAVVPEFAGRMLIGTSLTYFRVDQEKISPRYLAAYFKGKAFQDELAAVMSHSTRNQVPITAQRRLRVVLPSFPVQRAIAHILGTLDDKIELNRRMNETLEAMARALFKSWFVDFDPVRAKAEGRDPGLPPRVAELFPGSFEDSELGEIPKGWTVGLLGDAVEQLRDPENPLDFPDAEFRHFSIPAFDDGQVPKVEPGQSIKSLKMRVPPGVVLLSKLNPEIERVWLVDVEPDDRAVCSTEFLVLRPLSPFTRSYVYCLTRSPLFRGQIESLVTGTSKSHQRAQADSILNLPVVAPPASAGAAFGNLADRLLMRTLTCRRETGSLAALRDTLLPKLISGELRVEDSAQLLGSAD
jgi:type I restriction enzyme S subunit